MEAVAASLMELPDEERSDVAEESAYRQLLGRLSHQSVAKHFDAYADVPWDDPAYAVDPADPRFVLPADNPLGATAWYQNQPAPVQARIGLHMVATFARTGWSFESVLKRGLLGWAATLPDDAPEFRYAYHEVIEEAHHSLMFREFVLRTGLDVRAPRILKLTQHRVVRFARRFPELFFMLVLSGEDPIDWVQRRELQSGRERHPLIERISRIHIMEEARHMSFARHYLRRRVPRLRGPRVWLLRARTPMVFKVAAALMMRPSADIVRTYGIPREVMRSAYGRGSRHHRMVLAALRKPRELCWELGVLNDRWAPYWKALGLYAPRGAVIDC